MFDTLWRVAVALIGGYLLGGIPFGAIVGRTFYHADIRQLGSGATGATNVLRSFGLKAFVVVAVADVAKGAAAAGLALLVKNPAWSQTGIDLLVMGAGIAAIAGHMYSPFYGLHGGKGIATAAGAILVLMPTAWLVLAVVFVTTAFVTRIMSVASLVTALALPVAILVIYPGRPVLLAFAAVAVPLVFWAHRANIRRLLHGEEPRVTMKRRTPDKGDAS